MPRSLSAPTLAWALAALVACEGDAPTAGTVPDVSPRPEQAVVAKARAAIQDLVAAQLAAWNAKDADAFAATYAVDARFFNPIGNLYLGRQGIRDAHALLYAGPFAASSETQGITEVRLLTGTLAVVHLEAALTGYAGLPPGLSPTEPGVLRTTKTWLVEKRSGEWSILIQHMAPIGPTQ
jgi:uncharacterized protein (TIGR02246 family)